ncbi:hypothetical protein KFL_002030140 [Klebsormidium nitens]|uniref:MYND-type domain-containing protein n=1 Tax=Klebsormidium nitens TaxID=105231 RepID=A0A1Y1I450_KLENI|nr:hypothetical protein KFL_002030140 [Klebsormidium nitens]|eukprot:GAQ84732.1 hypothetical protein KFL_002030140 [Klebsormidium nitens]
MAEMVDESLDRTVERCASLLMTTNQDDLQAGINLLSCSLHMDNPDVTKHSRLLQEVAAYRGGILLGRLLLSLLKETPNGTESKQVLEGYFTLALSILSASKVVVERCLRSDGTRAEPEIALKICAALIHRIVGNARNLPKSEDLRHLSEIAIADSLECLVNFARGSKRFRDALRDSLDQRSGFEQFKDLLDAEFLSSLFAPVALKIRLHLSSLAVNLAFSADSQSWAIDMGLLKLVAAIYEASPLQELSAPSQRRMAPAFRCNKVLLRLLAEDTTAEKLRAHNAFSEFRPHQRKIHDAEPEPNPWQFFEQRLRGVTFRADTPAILAQDWKLVEESCSGSVPAHVVCAYKGCAASREPVVGKGFSKCGRCHVARYCSKEHQKLHWATHKVHCKEFWAGEGAL